MLTFEDVCIHSHDHCPTVSSVLTPKLTKDTSFEPRFDTLLNNAENREDPSVSRRLCRGPLFRWVPSESVSAQ